MGALTNAETTLATIETAAGSLPAEGRTALKALVEAALPTLRSSIDGLLGDSAISAILKPTLDTVLARLTAIAG
jgi:hypothetical protein